MSSLILPKMAEIADTYEQLLDDKWQIIINDRMFAEPFLVSIYHHILILSLFDSQ